MAYPNKIIRNAETGQAIRFIRTSRDTAGQLLEMEATFRAGSLRPPAHYHPHQVEDFTVVAGELTVEIGEELKTFRKGEHLHIPQNTIHAMWNRSASDTVVNWQVQPALETESFFETAFGLSHENRTAGRDTLSFRQKVGLARRFSSEFRLVRPSRFVQNILFGLVAAISCLLGNRSTR